MSVAYRIAALATLAVALSIAAPPAAADGVLPHVWGIAGEGLGFGHDVKCSAYDFVGGGLVKDTSCNSAN